MAELRPDPRNDSRAFFSDQVRRKAADLAYSKFPASTLKGGEETHLNNGEVTQPPYAMSFSKGLLHDDYGIVQHKEDFEQFLVEIGQQVDPSHILQQSTRTPFPNRPASFPDFASIKYRTPNNVYSFKNGHAEEGKPARFFVAHPDVTPQDGKTPDDVRPYDFHIPMAPDALETHIAWRAWESPLAGHVFDLEGPDAGAMFMPPAPKLDSPELTAEMAELYAMALLRDVPFREIEEGGDGSDKSSQWLFDLLKGLPWFTTAELADLGDREKTRRQARFTEGQDFALKDLFRGSTEGAKKGPYLSQFLLIGSVGRGSQQVMPQANVASQPVVFQTMPRAPIGAESLYASDRVSPTAVGGGLRPGAGGGDSVREGLIQYGTQVITQFFVPHEPDKNYLTDWASWIDIQNGADRRNLDTYLTDKDTRAPKPRFIHTPRDLATYVHFDALYQAYLNACLILMSLKADTDRGLPEGKGHPTRGGFATFGGPHILSLVTEVATRALKAVRRQKYQVHLRCRPEALGGVLSLSTHPKGEGKLGAYGSAGRRAADALPQALKEIVSHRNNCDIHADYRPMHDGSWFKDAQNLLLSQAFPEGSPMHPCYGAGHATVAGACTTVLKAYFEMYALKDGRSADSTKDDGPSTFPRADVDLKDYIELFESEHFQRLFEKEIQLTDFKPIEGAYRTVDDGERIAVDVSSESLSVQGELDKLAANIAIGRNFAGVHYYSDYYESLRMGERVAVGILQEQMLTYREPVSMRFRSFDGDYVMLTGSGGSVGSDDALIHVRDKTGRAISWENWWHRARIQSGLNA